MSTFDQVLEEIEKLPDEAQADLVQIVRQRLAERERKRILSDVREAEAELEAGKTTAVTPDDLMRALKA